MFYNPDTGSSKVGGQSVLNHFKDISSCQVFTSWLCVSPAGSHLALRLYIVLQDALSAQEKFYKFKTSMGKDS